MSEQVIRFSISDGRGHRAVTWRLWTPSEKSDAYLACRELRGSLKASLHQSGDWHVAYSQRTFEELVEGAVPTHDDRFLQRWPRPKPIAPGVTLAFRIVTPHSAVTSTINEEDRNITWIPNCCPPYATEIDILIVSTNVAVTGWPGKRKMGTKPIGTYNLSNGDSICAVYRIIGMPDFSSADKKTGTFYRGHTREDLKSRNLRALVFGQEADDSRVIFDCAVEGLSG